MLMPRAHTDRPRHMSLLTIFAYSIHTGYAEGGWDPRWICARISIGLRGRGEPIGANLPLFLSPVLHLDELTNEQPCCAH